MPLSVDVGGAEAAKFAMAIAGANTPLYFGWRVVAALFLCVALLMGVTIYAFIMFSAPLSQQFGWSAAQTGGLVSAMWLAGPLALFAAPLIKRFGAWRLVMLGMSVLVLTVAAVPLVSALWEVYVLRIGMGVGKVLIMTSMPVIVARWFERRFSTAMSVAWSGGAAGGLVMSSLTEALYTNFGWRAAAWILSSAILAAMLTAGGLARGAASPGSLGLMRDGDLGNPGLGGEESGILAATARADTQTDRGLETLKVGRGLTVLTMGVAVVASGMVAIAMQSQEPALILRAGLPGSFAAAMLGLTAGSALFGSVITGWLLDRAAAVWSCLIAGALVFIGIFGFGALGFTHSATLAGVAAAALGFGLGSSDVLWITLFKRQFGTAAFAITYGAFYFSLQVGFATGGSVGGWSLDAFGPSGLVSICAALWIPAVLFSLVRPAGRNSAGV